MLDFALISSVLVACVLIVLLAVFVWKFIVPAVGLIRSLNRTLRQLREHKGVGEWDLSACFRGDTALEHAWREYAETIHKPRRFDAATQTTINLPPRSTVPAEMVFSPQLIVDSRLNAEFFRHLPGLFTGVGIVGTFLGLVIGLSSFRISSDQAVIQASLTGLLMGVGDAFRVSLFAIFLAMVSTAVEKGMYNFIYAKVEAIRTDIDARFEAGAGEEYLSRLVDASEGSLTQTKQLKDALVSELKILFEELATRQIEAFAQSNEVLGRGIAESNANSTKLIGEHIARELKEPLDILAAANEKLSRDQSGAVETLLTDVLAGFAGQIEKLFGSQMTGIATLQQQTVVALEAAVRNIDEVSKSLQAAGSKASEDMARTLMGTLTAAELRQQEMAQGLAALMDQVRGQSASMQAEAQTTMGRMLQDMTDRIASSLAQLNDQANERQSSGEEAHGEFQKRAKATVDQMAGEIDRLQGEVGSVVGAARDMVDKLERVTGSLADRLNASTNQLLQSAESFERSGQGVTKSFDQIASVSTNLGAAATSVSSATTSLVSVVADHRAARDAVGEMVKALGDTVANAAKDNSLTGDILKRIEAATSKLVAAQEEAENYLGHVVEVLSESHAQFAEGMRVTLGQANRDFHKELSAATGLLKEAILELEFALPTVPNKSNAA